MQGCLAYVVWNTKDNIFVWRTAKLPSVCFHVSKSEWFLNTVVEWMSRCWRSSCDGELRKGPTCSLRAVKLQRCVSWLFLIFLRILQPCFDCLHFFILAAISYFFYSLPCRRGESSPHPPPRPMQIVLWTTKGADIDWELLTCQAKGSMFNVISNPSK